MGYFYLYFGNGNDLIWPLICFSWVVQPPTRMFLSFHSGWNTNCVEYLVPHHFWAALFGVEVTQHQKNHHWTTKTSWGSLACLMRFFFAGGMSFFCLWKVMGSPRSHPNMLRLAGHKVSTGKNGLPPFQPLQFMKALKWDLWESNVRNFLSTVRWNLFFKKFCE